MEISVIITDPKESQIICDLISELHHTPYQETSFKDTKYKYVILGVDRISYWTSFIVKFKRITLMLYRQMNPQNIKNAEKVYRVAAGQIVPPYSVNDINKAVRGMLFFSRKKYGNEVSQEK